METNGSHNNAGKAANRADKPQGRRKTLAIIGGGAAGLMAAIAAGDWAREQVRAGVHDGAPEQARTTSHAGVPDQGGANAHGDVPDQARAFDIVVYERDDRVGRTILATGNGRCNFSNLDLKLYEYHNEDFVTRALETAGDERFVRDFFEDLGLEWRAEADGRLYPLANKASVVVDVLRAALADLGVREACEREVVAIEPPRAPGKPFTLRMKDGVFERADAVIVACGGRFIASLGEGLENVSVDCFANAHRVAGTGSKSADADRAASADRHVTSSKSAHDGLAPIQLIPPKPVLGPLAVAAGDIPLVRELDNIRVRCSACLLRERDGAFVAIASETGELMFRKYGVSGICVFNLSRFARPGDRILINFMPDGTEEFPEDFLAARRRALAERFGEPVTYEQMLRGFLLPRVYEALLKRNGVKPGDVCRKRDVCNLAEWLAFFSLEVAGIGDEGICQVRRGGVAVDSVSAETMETRACPGLYVVGEALDVDGPCGGYNLHWAWTSGYLAGKNAAKTLLG